MTLSWSARQLADELVSVTTNCTSYASHRPDEAAELIDTALAELGTADLAWLQRFAARSADRRDETTMDAHREAFYATIAVYVSGRPNGVTAKDLAARRGVTSERAWQILNHATGRGLIRRDVEHTKTGRVSKRHTRFYAATASGQEAP